MLGFFSVFLISDVRMDSSIVFASLLPLNVDHAMIYLVGYNCAICNCYTQVMA